jgi:hypothetical protein
MSLLKRIEVEANLDICPEHVSIHLVDHFVVDRFALDERTDSQGVFLLATSKANLVEKV